MLLLLSCFFFEPPPSILFRTLSFPTSNNTGADLDFVLDEEKFFIATQILLDPFAGEIIFQLNNLLTKVYHIFACIHTRNVIL